VSALQIVTIRRAKVDAASTAVTVEFANFAGTLDPPLFRAPSTAENGIKLFVADVTCIGMSFESFCIEEIEVNPSHAHHPKRPDGLPGLFSQLQDRTSPQRNVLPLAWSLPALKCGPRSPSYSGAANIARSQEESVVGAYGSPLAFQRAPAPSVTRGGRRGDWVVRHSAALRSTWAVVIRVSTLSAGLRGLSAPRGRWRQRLGVGPVYP
jgi:hypothetical protein